MKIVNNSFGKFVELLQECPFCKSGDIGRWREKSENGVLYVIYKCASCESGFLNPRPEKKWLESVYAKSGHGLTQPTTLEVVLANEIESPNSSIDAGRLVGIASSYLSSPGRCKVLDIGSGYGFVSSEALRRGCNVVAVNPSVWENDVFERMNGFRPTQAFFEDVDVGDGFDIVVASQVLEHLSDPQKSLKKFFSILKKGGILAVAVPNINSFLVRLRGINDQSCFWVPEHQNYFSGRGLSEILKTAGLRPLRTSMVSRFHKNILSRRLELSGFWEDCLNGFVKYSQVPVCSLADFYGMGLYINIWARKD